MTTEWVALVTCLLIIAGVITALVFKAAALAVGRWLARLIWGDVPGGRP